MGKAAGLSSWAPPNPRLTWLHDVSGKVTGILKTGRTRARAPCGTLQPFAPSPRASVGLSLWWPWRIFLVAGLRVLCPFSVCLIMVEAYQRALVPSGSAECMELGIGVWEGSSDRLQAAEGVVDFN